MVVKFPQLSCPLTAFVFVCAADLVVIQYPLQFLIGKQGEIFCITYWAGLVGIFDSMNTLLTEVLPTAGGLVGLSENYQTDRTLGLNSSGRLLYKFTLITTLIITTRVRHLLEYNNQNELVPGLLSLPMKP
jgi:hypothetical protein